MYNLNKWIKDLAQELKEAYEDHTKTLKEMN